MNAELGSAAPFSQKETLKWHEFGTILFPAVLTDIARTNTKKKLLQYK